MFFFYISELFSKSFLHFSQSIYVIIHNALDVYSCKMCGKYVNKNLKQGNIGLKSMYAFLMYL